MNIKLSQGEIFNIKNSNGGIPLSVSGSTVTVESVSGSTVTVESVSGSTVTVENILPGSHDTDMEIGNSANTGTVRFRQNVEVGSSGDVSDEAPTLTVYGPTEFSQGITIKDGNAITLENSSGAVRNGFIKANGTVDSNSYATTSQLSGKQDTLVSGTNIKTINGVSILGSGNLDTGKIFEPGTGANSAVLKGSNGTAFGANSVVEGASVTVATDRGITTASTNAQIISEWTASTPDTDKFSLAKGEASHVEGNNGLALGDHSHVEGNGCIAGDNSSHAEGTGSQAMGKYAHAEGLESEAYGSRSHTEGYKTLAYNKESHAEGTKSIAGINTDNTAITVYDSAVTYNIGDMVMYDGALYTCVKASTKNKKPSGSSTYWRKEQGQHAEGEETTAATRASHAEGLTTLANGLAAHAEGEGTSATGEHSHAEGLDTIASGPFASHAEGEATEATGEDSHSEGWATKATNQFTHAEGVYTIANAKASHAEGYGSKTEHTGAHAEGIHGYRAKLKRTASKTYTNQTSGIVFTIGDLDVTSNSKVTDVNGTTITFSRDIFTAGTQNRLIAFGADANNNSSGAFGLASHAEGECTYASGEGSHAEGYFTKVELTSGGTSTTGAHAEGYETLAGEWASHAEGYNCQVNGTATANTLTADDDNIGGQMGHAEGNATMARGNAAHAEGRKTFAKGSNSHAEGYQTQALGDYGSHSEGDTTIASANTSHAEGEQTLALGINSHVEGFKSKTGGNDSSNTLTADTGTTVGRNAHAEGNATIAKGLASHAEGKKTFASGEASHAEGSGTTANGNNAHAEGQFTTASTQSSHAEGYCTLAKGDYSHAEGSFTKALNSFEHAEGIYNYSNTGNTLSAWTIHSIGIGAASNDRANAVEVMRNGDVYINGVGNYDGTNATASTSNTLQKCVGKMEEITWSNLKSLRDSSGLTPGMQYHITDYNTTTVQSDTQAAGHQFDIIVVADDNHTLNENARAVRHAGDTYFTGATLEAWELKYCLDNDTNRFLWADTGATGRGVIFYMKDECNNECHYDFKNIRFPRYKITACPKSPDLVGQYSIDGIEGIAGITVDTDTSYWCYTFTWITEDDEIEDLSIVGQKLPNNETQYYGVFDNKIECYYSCGLYPEDPSSFTFALTNNCFISTFGFEGGLFYGCYANRLGSNCVSNTFGNSCNFTTIGNDCVCNTFGNDCLYNSLGDTCEYNTFGNGCYYNSFGGGNYRNSFGNACELNSFGCGCGDNTFGDTCEHNSFGSGCNHNTFGNDCFYNSFGNKCEHNSFGSGCNHNSFGNKCEYNSFGNYFMNNTFGEDVGHFITGSVTGATTTAQTKSYIQYLIVENGVQCINAYCTGTTSSSNYCQNIKIRLGVKGTSSNNRLQIDITEQIGAIASVTYQIPNSLIIDVYP